MDTSPFTESELAYLSSQHLGRLATVAPDGAPQNNPVGFVYNENLGTVDICGFNLGATRKFKNLRSNPNVAFVVDDLVSISPWEVRGLESIISWNVGAQGPGMVGRNVADQPRVA